MATPNTFLPYLHYFPSFQVSLWAKKADKLPALISSGAQALEFYPVSLFADVINFLKKLLWKDSLKKLTWPLFEYLEKQSTLFIDW